MTAAVRAPRPLARLLAGAALLVAGTVAGHAGDLYPVPTAVIYPGDVIRDNMLTERAFNADYPGAAAAMRDMTGLIGKTVRHTLLPGQPISAMAVTEPKVVTVGAMVRVVYSEGGLTITTYASALRAGAVGEVIPCRNMESGLTISGVIDKDGSVRVGDS